MMRQAFNDGWTVAVRGSLFERHSKTKGKAVSLPHDAMLSAGRSGEGNPHLGYFHEGTWEYSKTFEVPEDWASRRVTLEFEGVYRDAMVFVNGAFAGQWANGYSTFYMPIDAFLFYGGTNEIKVEVQVHEDSRWYSGAGIYRPVNLLLGELVHIAPNGVRVSTPEVDNDFAVVAAATEVVNAGPNTRTVDTVLEVKDSDGQIVATDAKQLTLLAGERTTLRHRSYLPTPALWSTETPNLYTASVRLVSPDGHGDEATTSFGVRTVSVDPFRGLRINGEPVKLRGANLHHDHGILGAAEFDHAAERRVKTLKAAGFNAIRSAAKPASRAILDACDRVGMLVVDETWDMWHMSKTEDDYSRRFAQWWERDIDALIRKDFNHPSVVIYSIGSEIIEAGTPHGARWSRLISERIRTQDDSRFITNAINGMMVPWVEPAGSAVATPEEAPSSNEEGTDDNQTDDSFNFVLAQVFESVIGQPSVGERLSESAGTLDIFGLNYGDVRYELDKADYPNRVVLGTETFPSRIAHNWKLVLANDHVIGDFTWVGWDYLGEPGVGRPKYPGEEPGFTAPFPGLTGYCADIDLNGQRLPVSFYREVVFGLAKGPYLTVQRPEHRDHPWRPDAWSWSDTVASWTWDVPAGSFVTAEAYSDADEIVFLVNGTEAARAKVGEELPYLATAEVPYHSGTIEAVAYKDGTETGRHALNSAGALARVGVTPDKDQLRGDLQDIVYVDITLCDGDGRINPLNDVKIDVEVQGPAVLQGLGSARPVTEESFLETSCTTYQGRALAVLRYSDTAGSDRTADSVSITVRAADLPTATTTIRLAPNDAGAGPSPAQ
jgi:beta-galactosidase